ncbi:FAD-dependent oxidoreductase, partial [Oscillospiraceae bacterium OttesenSCG-928-G22]|nr:FAD-dependent oxidoreductase [Oscillospiraceae bacterium OttesenSCG-928-G22]
MSKKILIVGGVAGGASAAARLRRLDENAEIILFERGEYISFANCGLPYYIGGEIKDKSALLLQTPQSFNARFNVDVRVQNEVTAIDRENKTVTVKQVATGETYTECYDELILSMGAAPIKPPIPGIDSAKVFTLRNIPDTYRIKDYIEANKPRSAVIVGGGFIGVEMAENLTHAGLEVTMVELADQILAPLDRDMACEVQRHVRQKGVKLLLENAVAGVAETTNGLQITLNDGEVFADMLILSIGVRPESSIAREAGLETNARGGILVNDRMQTTDPNIYAVGDAIEVVNFVTGQKAMVPLAGPANKQGRIAADNICGINSAYPGTQGSSILKAFDLTVATTGINEKTAKAQGLNYEKSFTYSASHATYYPGAVNMSIKTIFDKATGKILGAQVVGYEGADKRCDVIATAIHFGATAADLTKLELCYAPPFSSAKDPVNMAGYTIENILTGKTKIFHWHDVRAVQQDSDAILLDVRTPMEFENGSISTAVNIPLDELRDRLSELDAAKKIYVTCQIGLRGYVACRLLSQHGFDCHNLSGGYRLYQTIFGAEHPAAPQVAVDSETQRVESPPSGKLISLDACGLQCPGPIVKLGEALKTAHTGDTIEISTTDPAFASDVEGFCRRTGHVFGGLESSKGISVARITKMDTEDAEARQGGNGKNFIVFS